MIGNFSPAGRRPRALVTGASSGIGYELARIFGRNGYDLVLISRTKPILDQLAAELRHTYGTNAIVLRKDLSQQNAAREIFDRLTRQRVTIDVLVNNAGFGIFGPFVEHAEQDQLSLLQVNIVTLTHLTRLFAAEMVRRKHGRILNVASTAAFQPGPMMATYYASKAYILSFSEALAHELRGSGVTVSCVCPGPTRTQFQKRARMEGTHLFHPMLMMSAERVAQVAFDGLMKGRRVVIPGFLNRMGTIAARIAPHTLIMDALDVLHNRR